MYFFLFPSPLISPLPPSTHSFNTNCYALCAEIHSLDDADAAAAAANRSSGKQGGGGDASSSTEVAFLGASDTSSGYGDDDALLDGAAVSSISGGSSDNDGEERVESAGGFTVFQLVQNLGSAAWYYVSLQLPVHDAPTLAGSFTQVYLQVALLALATVTFVAVDWRHAGQRTKRAEGAGA